MSAPEPAQKQNEPPKSARQDKIGSAEGFHLTQPKAASAGNQKEITFRFEAPTAREVLLAAEFTNWDKNPVKLIKGGGGVWHAKLALAPGRHLYRFLVDGQWHDDPNCASRVPNPFGSSDSVVEII
jgi:1,4-alpha-glucan branching enzyme